MHRQNIITKSFYAGSPIPAYTQVKFGANDTTVVPATASTDLIIGTTNELAIDASDIAKGNTVDVVLSGITEVVAGAAIPRGAKVTSDNSGRAVLATSGHHTAGIAMAAAVSVGDIIPMLISQSIA